MSSPIWLLDRSRVVDGRGFCQRARLLGYHIGPNGYGITMKATRLPLMTGIAGHDGLAPILQWCADFVTTPPPFAFTTPHCVPDEIVRGAIKAAQQKYWDVVVKRGFAYLSESEEVQAVTREQNYLIEGLIWAWVLEVLPEVLQRGRIVEVEHDDTYVFDCTCGLSDGVGTRAEHEARDCNGLGLMCRPDFLVETWQTQELEYHEFKTTAMDSVTFRDKWEVMVQMFAATLDAERRLGKHVQSIYVHGLVKGKRGGEYNIESGKYDGVVRQQSIFCYGYRKPANPPMEVEQWEAQYAYVDEEGKNRRLGKLFRKTGVWEIPDDYLLARTSGEVMSKGEFWAKWMPSAARRSQLLVLGPFSRQTQMVQHFLEEAKGEERRWQEGLWQLHDLALEILADHGDPQAALWWEVVWPDARFQALMDKLFPRSYACRRYGGRNRCQFEDPCLEREGWADPVGSGRFIERTPHHLDETVQMAERGLTPVDAALAEDPEGE